MLRCLFFLSAIVFFFALFFHSSSQFNQDLGRHLILGKIITETGKVPTTNLFSYTYPDFPFVNSHWLPEVIYYLLSQKFGLSSLVVFNTIVMVVALALVLFAAYRLTGNLAAVSLGFIIFSPVLLNRTEIRPETFSYLFTALFIAVIFSLLTRSDFKLSRRHLFILFALPLVELIWVNSHIYFFLGPVLAIFLLIAETITLWRSRGKLLPAPSWLRWEMLAIILTFAVTVINPNGLKGALFPLLVFNNYGYSVLENQNIIFLSGIVFEPTINFFFIAAGVFVLSFALRSYFWNRSLIFSWLTLPLIALSFLSLRSLPFLYLINFPAFTANIAAASAGVSKSFKDYLARYRWLPVALVIFAVVVTLLRAWRLISNDYYLATDADKEFGTEVIASGRGALDFFRDNHLRGPLFNNFDIGGYLDYGLYPRERVFTDNRPEAFPANFFRETYIPLQQTPENFAQADKVYRFNTIIYSHADLTPWGQKFSAAIIKNPEWQLVYLDSFAAILVKKQTFPEIALKDAIKPESLLSAAPNRNYRENVAAAFAAELFGWQDVSRKLLEIAYRQNPESPEVLSALGQLYLSQPGTISLGQQMITEYKAKSSLILF